MSTNNLPFEPFLTPRVAPASPALPTPINWFERIAPTLGPTIPTPRPVESTEPGAARLLTFGDIDLMASEERRKRDTGKAEPAEIVALRKQAQVDAEAILEQARTAAVQVVTEARERGYQIGFKEGWTEGERSAAIDLTARADAERNACRADLQDLVDNIEATRRLTWEQIEPQVIGMILDLTKQVIKQEVNENREIVISMIRNALRRVSDDGALRIRVNPRDLEVARTNRAELVQILDGIRHIEIVDDRRIGEGGCIVETDAGNIDARIETQIREVEAVLDTRVLKEAA